MDVSDLNPFTEVEQPRWNVTFEERQLEPIKIEGYTQEDNPTEIKYNITQSNITHVTFILTWIDDGKHGFWMPEYDTYDTFYLRVFDTNGTGHFKMSKFERIEMDVNMRGIPDNLTLRRKSIDDVIEYLNGTQIASDREEKYNWTINISVDAEGYTNYLPILIFCPFYDRGNDWKLDIITHYYVANITKAQ